MKQSALGWIIDQLFELRNPTLNQIEIVKKAREIEKQQQDDFAIGFAEWFTNEKSEYSIMYGNQEKRFATFTKEYTTKQLLEIFKNK